MLNVEYVILCHYFGFRTDRLLAIMERFSRYITVDSVPSYVSVCCNWHCAVNKM